MNRGGRRYGRAHLPVESCHSLTAWGQFTYAQMWEDDDSFSAGWTGGDDSMDLTFTRDGRRYTQHIEFTFSHCNYGGNRLWFRCPSCGRRVGKLFLPATLYIRDWQTGMRERTHTFACRHCCGLTYLQRQDRSKYWTLLHRADRLLERWGIEKQDKFFYKPKGMRRQRFDAVIDRWEGLIEESNGTWVKDLGKLERLLGHELGAGGGNE